MAISIFLRHIAGADYPMFWLTRAGLSAKDWLTLAIRQGQVFAAVVLPRLHVVYRLHKPRRP